MDGHHPNHFYAAGGKKASPERVTVAAAEVCSDVPAHHIGACGTEYETLNNGRHFAADIYLAASASTQMLFIIYTESRCHSSLK